MTRTDIIYDDKINKLIANYQQYSYSHCVCAGKRWVEIVDANDNPILISKSSKKLYDDFIKYLKNKEE